MRYVSSSAITRHGCVLATDISFGLLLTKEILRILSSAVFEKVENFPFKRVPRISRVPVC